MATKRRSSIPKSEPTFGGGDDVTFVGEMPATEALGIDPSEARSNPQKELANCVIRAGAVVFDPFKEAVEVKTIDAQIDEVENAWNDGKLSREDAMKILGKIYTVNHSVGRNILDDERLKPENRIMRYAAHAVAHGEFPTIDKAEEYAIGYLLSKKNLAGRWGTRSHDIDVRSKKQA